MLLLPQTVFGYIDRILANAALAGLKIIVVPINNWEEIDGVPIYLQVPCPARTTGVLLYSREAQQRSRSTQGLAASA